MVEEFKLPSLAPYVVGSDDTLRGHVSDFAYKGVKHLGGSDDWARTAGSVTNAIADLTPVVGDLSTFQEADDEFSEGNWGMGLGLGVLGAIGSLPLFGDAVSIAGRAGLKSKIGKSDTLAGAKDPITLQSSAHRSGEPHGDNGRSRFSDEEVGAHLDPELKRSASEQYPRVPETGENGVLTRDLDGNPLGARYIAGLRDKGFDHPLKQGELNRLAEDLTGKPIRTAPGSHADLTDADGRPRLGITYFDPRTNLPVEILLNKDLTPSQKALVSAHEIGHAVDLLAKKIPINGIEDDLMDLYHRQATGSGPIAGQRIHTPELAGYPADEVRDEYIVEAIRAYFLTPNELKKNYPKVAKRIREYVNTDKKLKKSIQFNTIAGAAVTGGAVGLAAKNGQDTREKQQDF